MRNQFIILFLSTLLVTACSNDDSIGYFPYDAVPGAYDKRVHFQIDTISYQNVEFDVVALENNRYSLTVNNPEFTEEVIFSITPEDVVKSYFTTYYGVIELDSEDFVRDARAYNHVKCWFEEDKSGVYFSLTFMHDSKIFYLWGEKGDDPQMDG